MIESALTFAPELAVTFSQSTVSPLRRLRRPERSAPRGGLTSTVTRVSVVLRYFSITRMLSSHTRQLTAMADYKPAPPANSTRFFRGGGLPAEESPGVNPGHHLGGGEIVPR